YTMPGATHGTKTLDDFDPAKTKRMRVVVVGGLRFDVLTSESGFEQLHREIRQAGEERVARTAWRHPELAPYGTGWNTLDAMLAAARAARRTRDRGGQRRRRKTLWGVLERH